MSYERYEFGNNFSMKELDGGPIIRGKKNTVRLIRGNTMKKSRLQVFFMSLITLILQIVGRVVRLEISSEILEANQGKVILDRKHFSFLVQMIGRGPYHTVLHYPLFISLSTCTETLGYIMRKRVETVEWLGRKPCYLAERGSKFSSECRRRSRTFNSRTEEGNGVSQFLIELV